MSDERTVRITNALSWVNLRYDPPYTGWRSVELMNSGPSTVEASINFPEVNKLVLVPGKLARYDTEPIDILFFRSVPGLNATVKMVGGV